jgi:hypothetical protein
VRAKLHEIQRERDRAQSGLTNTSEELAVRCSPRSLPPQPDVLRTHYIDDLEVADDEKTPLFAEVRQAEAFLSNSTDSLALSDLLSVRVSSKPVMVELRMELRGLEHLRPSGRSPEHPVIPAVGPRSRRRAEPGRGCR